MQNNYNFTTKTVIDPLATITNFYVNPYMPDNMKLLGLKFRTKQVGQDIFNVHSTIDGHIVILFPIEFLVDGPCHIKWTEEGKFCIDNRIWCKIMSDNTVRVDTVRY